MSLISISDIDEEGMSLALLGGGVTLCSTGSTDCTDELCRVDSHAENNIQDHFFALLSISFPMNGT